MNLIWKKNLFSQPLFMNFIKKLIFNVFGWIVKDEK